LSALGLIFAQASPTASISASDANTIPLKDSLALIVSAASFVVSAAAFMKTNFDRRRGLLLDQVLAELTTLEASSVEITQQVESILLKCAHSGLSPQDSYLATQHGFRRAEQSATNLEALLSSESAQIHKHYVSWHWSLTQDRFPVLNPRDVYQPTDERFLAVGTALTEWRRFLFNLRVECLHHRIRFWKNSHSSR